MMLFSEACHARIIIYLPSPLYLHACSAKIHYIESRIYRIFSYNTNISLANNDYVRICKLSAAINNKGNISFLWKITIINLP